MTDWQTVKVYAATQGVPRRQVHTWIKKGAVEVDRLAPATGVRVRPGVQADHDDDE